MPIKYRLNDTLDPHSLQGQRFEFVISDEIWAIRPVKGGPMIILAQAVKPRVKAVNGQPTEVPVRISGREEP